MSQHSPPARHAVDDHFGEPQAVGDETVRDPTKIVNVAGRWRNRSSTGSQTVLLKNYGILRGRATRHQDFASAALRFVTVKIPSFVLAAIVRTTYRPSATHSFLLRLEHAVSSVLASFCQGATIGTPRHRVLLLLRRGRNCAGDPFPV